jgi:hypothetical protein
LRAFITIPLKKDTVAGVTVLTLGSGGSSLFMHGLLAKAGLLSMMATLRCFVNGMVAASNKVNNLMHTKHNASMRIETFILQGHTVSKAIDRQAPIFSI